jgi:hypothetical protein
MKRVLNWHVAIKADDIVTDAVLALASEETPEQVIGLLGYEPNWVHFKIFIRLLLK